MHFVKEWEAARTRAPKKRPTLPHLPTAGRGAPHAPRLSRRIPSRLGTGVRNNNKGNPACVSSCAAAIVRNRFSAKRLAAQRQRLGLSADAVGLLVGTSGQSIYNWEAGKARPRASHLAAIAALRTLSKTQAADILASRKSAK